MSAVLFNSVLIYGFISTQVKHVGKIQTVFKFLWIFFSFLKQFEVDVLKSMFEGGSLSMVTPRICCPQHSYLHSPRPCFSGNITISTIELIGLYIRSSLISPSLDTSFGGTIFSTSRRWPVSVSVSFDIVVCIPNYASLLCSEKWKMLQYLVLAWMFLFYQTFIFLTFLFFYRFVHICRLEQG